MVVVASAIASPIERVRQAVPIGEIAAERVALVKAGRALRGLCPFHAEQTPSFYVYPESGRFHSARNERSAVSASSGFVMAIECHNETPRSAPTITGAPAS